MKLIWSDIPLTIIFVAIGVYAVNSALGGGKVRAQAVKPDTPAATRVKWRTWIMDDYGNTYSARPQDYPYTAHTLCQKGMKPAGDFTACVPDVVEGKPPKFIYKSPVTIGDCWDVQKEAALRGLNRPTCDEVVKLHGKSHWECEKGYKLDGFKVSWPAGVALIEPERCLKSDSQAK